ncbi:MAG: aminotransferase class I/II-fold pyridoxal phosphate-dependent enzyme [Clostridiales bacterium]|jgi:histidinol-phosphate aminotransferase|nr:aminotransferase class I/II-fold pyridoxal phosphate-dependent enzyme [Clostridiales bacterium]
MKFSELLKGLTPYTAGEQPKNKKYIKLNTNENAYPPSPSVRGVLAAFDADALRLYPDPDASELKLTLAERYGLSPENIFTGNGSDEILGFCFPAFFDRESPPVLFPDVTYSFYPVYAALYGIPYKTPPLRADYTVDAACYSPLVSPSQGVIIANPNAPTGIALPLYGIEEILVQNRETVVIVDEAYAEFGGVTAMPLIDEYDNLLVVRTFSKAYSLAGIRCGYAVGQKPLIDALGVIKNSFNSYTLDSLTIKIAAAACRDMEYYDMINERIANIRDGAARRLRADGFTVLDSAANFLFLKKDGVCGERLFSALKERGILTRHFKGSRTSDFIRATVGTDTETEVFCGAVKEIADGILHGKG